MRVFSRIFLPLILLSYIVYETWLKLHHQSLCSASGCKLAGELLRFPSIYLNYLGIAAVMAILVLGILSILNRAFEKLYFLTLYCALAFESIMIAYQIMANPEPCLFCLGVYAGLVLIAIFSRPIFFLYALPAIMAIFFAISDLAIPRNEALIKGDGLYLIASKHCPHCKKVKAYFKKHHIDYKTLPVSNPSVRHLAKALGIKEIPILLKRQNGLTTILYGDRSIIALFEEAKKEQSEPSAMPNIPADLYSNPQEGGCSLNPIESSGGGCEAPQEEIRLR